MAKQEKPGPARRTQGAERNSEGPRAAAEVIFFSSGTLTVTPGGKKWEPFPTPGVSGQFVGTATYTWCGEGSWKTLDGQGEAGTPPAAAGDERGGDSEQGRGS
jgi:hypothetical protein